MKKLGALILCMALLLCTFPGMAETVYPDYLNLDSAYPIVKEDYDITISVAYVTSSSYASAETALTFKTMRELLNIDLELVPIDSSAVSERTNLMFASQEVQDVLLGFSFGPNTILQYGVNEGQLLAIDEYITPELTPNIVAATEMYPELLIWGMAPDGKNYFVPRLLSADSPGDNSNINVAWLEALGLESPKTLDEFLDVMYKFK